MFASRGGVSITVRAFEGQGVTGAAWLAKAVPTGPDWLHEVKFDGYRVQAHKVGRDVVIFSRNGHDFTGRFATVALQLRHLPAKCEVDGQARPLKRMNLEIASRAFEGVFAGQSVTTWQSFKHDRPLVLRLEAVEPCAVLIRLSAPGGALLMVSAPRPFSLQMRESCTALLIPRGWSKRRIASTTSSERAGFLTTGAPSQSSSMCVRAVYKTNGIPVSFSRRHS